MAKPRVEVKLTPAEEFPPPPLSEDMLLKERFEEVFERNVGELSLSGIPKRARKYKIEYDIREITVSFNNPKLTDGIRDALRKTMDEIPNMLKGL